MKRKKKILFLSSIDELNSIFDSCLYCIYMSPVLTLKNYTLTFLALCYSVFFFTVGCPDAVF
jgi:hypothetical protein